MKWAGHNDLRLRQRTKKGCRKRGRPQLGWEHCVKRDLRKAEEKKLERKGQQRGPMENVQK